MSAETAWEFTDDRGITARSPRRPQRIAAYLRAGAGLWEHGLTPVGVYGSGHDGDSVDPVKAGRLPAGTRYLGAGKTLDEEALGAVAPELIVDVTYDEHFAYAVDDGVAGALGMPVVALSVAGQSALTGIVDRFAALAASLGAVPDTSGDQALTEAGQAVRDAAADPGTPQVLVLSAAGPDQVHLARPEAWPELRHLRELGVPLLDPGPGPGVNWLTTDWEYAAGLGAGIILSDARGNAAPAHTLTGVAAWRRLTDECRVQPWNPELPPAAGACAAFLRDVAQGLTAR